MKTDELVKRLLEYAEWARANEWEVPITLADALEAAADTIERLDNFVDSQCCRLLEKLQKSKFSNDESTERAMERLVSCDLLVIDDLGTEYPGQMVNTLLYTLINDRMMEHRPMIISTNLTMEQIQGRYSSQIASRLRGGFSRLLFLGEDIRVLKSRF